MEPDSVVISSGGGQVLLACAAARVRCGDDALLQLAVDLEALEEESLAIERLPPAAVDARIRQWQDPDPFGEERDGLWLQCNWEPLRPPIASVLAGVAADIVTAAEGDALAELWRQCLVNEDEALALRCLDRGAAALGEFPWRPQHGSGYQHETPVRLAAGRGHGTVLRRLGAAGHSPTLPDAAGFTPLHIAAVSGQAAAVRQLIEMGADPLARAAGGRTPLAYARQFCADRALPAVEAVLWPIEWPRAAARARYQTEHRPGSGDS